MITTVVLTYPSTCYPMYHMLDLFYLFRMGILAMSHSSQLSRMASVLTSTQNI